MAEPTVNEILNIAPAGGDTVSEVARDIGLWKSLTNFVVDYEDVSDYWRPKTKQRPIFADAVAKAKTWFEERGAIFPVMGDKPFPDDAIEIRTYPRTYQVVFFFKRSVAGKPLECGIPYPLNTDMVGWLKATGRWPKTPEGALN
jgi:hypothetical protein